MTARLARRARQALAACIAGVWMLSAVAQNASPEPPLLTVDRAAVRFEPEGRSAVEGTNIDLLRRWDQEFPGRDGRAVYRILLPPHVGDGTMALLFSRVGNQVEVAVNGSVLQHWGRLGDPAFDAGKIARMTVVPARFLRADRANELTVEVTVQQQRWGGLSTFQYGPVDRIEPLVEAQLRWRQLAVLVFGWSLVAMAALALALWWRHRDPLYGCFVLAALFGTVRDLDRLWAAVWIPWPAWGAVEAACYAVHLALIARFVQMAGAPLHPAMRRAIDSFMVFAVGLALLGFASHRPWLWTVVLATLIPLGAASFAVVVRNARRTGHAAAWVLPAAGALAVGAGTYDFLLIRLGASSGFRVQLTPPAMFAFVIVMGGIVVQRYNRSVADHRALHAQLVERIGDRERELQLAFDALRETERRESIAEERQRMMQAIHDGVGSQLVGLLQLVRQPEADRAALAEHVDQALDEMRMAVDSLQPAHDDLVTVLATLRSRLEPRLEAAGVAIVWQVSDLPALLPLSPHAVLQVQRIVMEAFTNVLKHARATELVVQTCVRAAPATVVLRIADNGVGLVDTVDRPPAGRHGLHGMRRRAEAVGASIRIEGGPTGGVAVTLEWRLQAGPMRVAPSGAAR